MRILYFISKDPYSDKKYRIELSALSLRNEFNKNSFKSGFVSNNYEKLNIKGDYIKKQQNFLKKINWI